MPKSDFIRQVQRIETGILDVPAPAGLAFSPLAGSFLVLESKSPAPVDSESVLISPTAMRGGSLTVPASVDSLINVTFDPKANRLLISKVVGANPLSCHRENR